MKHLTRLLLLTTASALWVGTASASTFASDSTTVSYLGYNASPTTLSNLAPAGTFDIGTGGVWSGPLTGSSWVSFMANTEPGGANGVGVPNPVVPNGDYTYAINIGTVAAGSTISITVLADDTTSLYLDGMGAGNQEFGDAAAVPAAHCTTTQPNCENAYTFVFTDVAGGTNQMLYFGVDQDFGNATGLDFVGTVTAPVTTTPTPEPSSLMLLGTGLLGAAGMLRRRIRA